MKKLRTIAAALALALCPLVAEAQIALSPYVPAYAVDGLDGNMATLLENKLRSLLSANGIDSKFGDSRFVLVAGLSETGKEALNTSPAKVVTRLNLNIAVGDGIDGKCYGSRCVEITGVGVNDTQAVANAVRGLNGKKIEGLADLLVLAKQRILSYYEENAASIIKSANTQVAGGNYDEAILMLSQIPQECSAYASAQSAMQTAFKKRVNYNSAKLLTEASADWASNPSSENADRIVATLSEIDPNSTSYAEAKALIKKIEAQGKLEQTRAYNLEQKRLDKAAEVEKARLAACAKVAAAYAKSRPRVVYHVNRWW